MTSGVSSCRERRMDGFLLIQGGGATLERALTERLGAAWYSRRNAATARIQLWRFRRPTFTLARVSEASGSGDRWLDLNPEVGGSLAHDLKRRVFVLLGDDHEQRVFSFDASGRGSLELEGPAGAPFATLAKQLAFPQRRWLWPAAPPVEARLTRPVPPPRPQRGVATPEVLEVPRKAARSPRALSRSWTRHGQTIASLKGRSELLQFAPRLPLLDELVTVSVELSESEWRLLESASGVLRLAPGMLLAAALFAEPQSARSPSSRRV
ncbi:MAG: hypothetical protein SFW67_10850 [Myxococcaceae bacterium]|nr:hypothetical protein [Myxococcaceae bacterium]